MEESLDEGKGIPANVFEDDTTNLSNVPSMNNAGQMRNSATNADYHESCRLLYATPLPEGGSVRYHDPILVRAEYPRLYDRLKFLHNQGCKAILTGQPGIGDLPLCS